MQTFNTYAEILAASGNQVTGQELINRRLYLKDGGWQTIELSENLADTLARDISNILGGRIATKKAVYNTLVYSKPQHWGLSRILLEQYGDSPARLSYCAGQDYTWECNAIRSKLK